MYCLKYGGAKGIRYVRFDDEHNLSSVCKYFVSAGGHIYTSLGCTYGMLP